MHRRVYYFVSRNLASFCKDTRKVMLAWKTTKENEPVNPQLCKHPPWLCKKLLFLTFKDLCFDMISTLCLCRKLNWFLKTDGPYGFKNPCYIKENKSQLFCCRLSAPCVQSEVCRGELGRGGKPCGVTDGKGRGCSWQALLVCGCPCCGSRKCLARALGKGGRGHRRWRWAAILPDSEHVPFLLCLCFPGASAAVSLAERESGVLQYRSALWWWVHTCASSCLARASRTYISFPAPFSGWGVFGWAPIRFGAKEATENNVKKN